jgi:uncharacterized protein (DUF1501 family)
VDKVGKQLTVTPAELAAFKAGGPLRLDNGMAESFALAQKLIIGGVVDCINLGVGGFDTHANQSMRLEPTLTSVDFVIKRFVDGLKAAGALDKTLIVLYSDFGRTPKINNSQGRDHWPIGSAIMIGGGIQGGRVVGGTDDAMRSLTVNAETGLVDSSGMQLNPTHVGGAVIDLTLGEAFRSTYRSYLPTAPFLTKLKG